MKTIVFSFILLVSSLSQAQALDDVLTVCRKLGPWPRVADSDYCSCLKGNLGYIAQAEKAFKLDQVHYYVIGLYKVKLGRLSPRKLASIPDSKTRGLFKSVSQVCEKNPRYRKPQSFIGNKTNSAETSVPMFVPL